MFRAGCDENLFSCKRAPARSKQLLELGARHGALAQQVVAPAPLVAGEVDDGRRRAGKLARVEDDVDRGAQAGIDVHEAARVTAPSRSSS